MSANIDTLMMQVSNWRTAANELRASADGVAELLMAAMLHLCAQELEQTLEFIE